MGLLIISLSRGRAPAGRLAALALGGLLAAGCGGSAQSAGEPNAQFTVQVLRASFPKQQAIARPTKLELELRNSGERTVPNVAVTVNSFYYRSEYPHLSDPNRPIWIVDQGPGAIPRQPVESVQLDSPGADTTANNATWSAGALGAGETRTFTWMLTPVRSGTHEVAYSVAGGLNGKSTAQQANGSPVSGNFSVQIAAAPPITHVNPETGAVETGRPPVAPGP
ncbi:MAG: hypothetical protein ACYDA6_04540 [Solirubrobacteraceae bacterium]